MNGERRRGRVWVAVVVALLAGVAITLIGLIVTRSASVTSTELRMLEALDLRHTAPANALALMINDGFGPIGAAVVGVGASVLAGLTLMSWREGVRFAVLIAVPWLSVSLIKIIVERPRPDMAALADVLVPQPSSTSFPSGHTAFATALGCAVVITVARHVRRRAVIVLVVLGALALASVTAWSRMYLGVHQPSDVAASMVFVPIAAWATAECLDRFAAGRSRVSE